MAVVDENDFQQQKECLFEGERYSVRDNGAILRHPPGGKRSRAQDNKWTFGKEDTVNGYLYISGARVHRIVATAFLGEPVDPKYVVDHIDSNRKNNRPENLRWLSRLENTLKNEVTRKKIEYLCGSVEAFLENPSMLNALQVGPNLSWMRTVTPEEAKNCKERMSLWARSASRPQRSADDTSVRSTFGERVFKPIQKWEVGLAREPGLELAKTPRCAQYMWRADAYFPCCPKDLSVHPLEEYFRNLKPGAIFAHSDEHELVPVLTLIEFSLLESSRSILAMCEGADRRWWIIGVTLDERHKYFIHFYLGSFSRKEEAGIAFLIKKGLPDYWSDAFSQSSKL